MKYCPRCGHYKAYGEFYKGDGTFGLSGMCRPHHSEAARPSVLRYQDKHRKHPKGEKRYTKMPVEKLKTSRYKEKRIINDEILAIAITDETPKPVECPYQGSRMMDIPAWYLLTLLKKKCPKNIREYIQNNQEVLEQEIRK